MIRSRISSSRQVSWSIRSASAAQALASTAPPESAAGPALASARSAARNCAANGRSASMSPKPRSIARGNHRPDSREAMTTTASAPSPRSRNGSASLPFSSARRTALNGPLSATPDVVLTGRAAAHPRVARPAATAAASTALGEITHTDWLRDAPGWSGSGPAAAFTEMSDSCPRQFSISFPQRVIPFAHSSPPGNGALRRQRMTAVRSSGWTLTVARELSGLETAGRRPQSPPPGRAFWVLVSLPAGCR